MHSFHYQDTGGRECVPWCVEVEGTITHDRKFDGQVAIIHEDIYKEYYVQTFECEEPRRVIDNVVYHMWGFAGEFYDFEFDRMDTRRLKNWFKQLGLCYN